MNIIVGTLALMALAGWVWIRLASDDRRQVAIFGVRRMVVMNLPRLMIALISAGLFAELLPQTLIRHYVGESSGFYGVLIGMGLGIVTPGGAFVSFALAAGAMQAGATVPAMIAYITAWALFALTKIITEELAFLGPHFLLTRIAISLPIPLVAGAIALLL